MGALEYSTESAQDGSRKNASLKSVSNEGTDTLCGVEESLLFALEGNSASSVAAEAGSESALEDAGKGLPDQEDG